MGQPLDKQTKEEAVSNSHNNVRIVEPKPIT